MSAHLMAIKKPFKIAIFSAVLAAIISLFLPNYYMSKAKILPVDVKGSAGGLGGLAAAAASYGLSIPGSDGGDSNFVDILQSRWLGESLLFTRFHFKDRNWRFGLEKEREATLLEYIDKRNVDRAFDELQKMMTVSKDLKSKVITLSVETKYPTLSREIVRQAIILLEQFNQEKGRTRGGAKAVFAGARLVEARSEMAQAEEELREFLEVNRNSFSSTDPTVRLKGMRLETELKLHQQVVATLSISREQALMEEKNDLPIVNLLDPGNLPIEKSRPARTNLILSIFIFVFLGSWAWIKRDYIKEKLRAD